MKLLELTVAPGGGWRTVWRALNGQRVHFLIAPGANVEEACARIQARLSKPPTTTK